MKLKHCLLICTYTMSKISQNIAQTLLNAYAKIIYFQSDLLPNKFVENCWNICQCHEHVIFSTLQSGQAIAKFPFQEKNMNRMVDHQHLSCW